VGGRIDAITQYDPTTRGASLSSFFARRQTDTEPDVEARQIELLSRAPAARRAALALSLSATVITLARRALGRHPLESQEEAALRFVELHYGADLAVALRRHLPTSVK
jgi:hypothetical protein